MMEGRGYHTYFRMQYSPEVKGTTVAEWLVWVDMEMGCYADDLLNPTLGIIAFNFPGDYALIGWILLLGRAGPHCRI